jgi:hypothetical protein
MSNQSRIQERAAVNAARTLFESFGLRFQEIDVRNDIGKDAYLDVAQSDEDIGVCVALQIKGGRKYKRRDGYVIPMTQRLYQLWAESSLPVFGIVRDADLDRLYWLNVTRAALDAGPGCRQLRVPKGNWLESNSLPDFLGVVRDACRSHGSHRLLALLDSDLDRQFSALYDCLAIGRSDPRSFVLLRSLLVCFRSQDVFRTAVSVLAHVTPHPDIFWHKGNWIPERICDEVRPHLRWSPGEITALLARVVGDDILWQRGTVSQSLLMLLLQDPCLEGSLDEVLTGCLTSNWRSWEFVWALGPPFGPAWVTVDRERIASAALSLALYCAGRHARKRMHEISDRLPPLMQYEWCRDIAEYVEEWGVFLLG